MPLDVFGGLVTTQGLTDLRLGVASALKNVEFAPGSVRQRAGYGTRYAAFSGTPKVNGIVQVVGQDLIRTTAFGGDNGTVYIDRAGAYFSAVINNYELGSRWGGTNLYSRMFLAAGDGKFGMSPALTLSAPVNNWFNYHTGAPELVFPLGTATPVAAPGLTPGVHKVVLVGEYEDGSLSAPSNVYTFTAVAGQYFSIISPWGVFSSWHPNAVALRAYMTEAGGALYYLAATANTASPITINMLDATLNKGPLGSDLFRNFIPSGPAAIVGPYKGRICFLGTNHSYNELHDDTWFQNLKFSSNVTGGPVGWHAPAAGGAITVSPFNDRGGAYVITGNGTASPGAMAQDGLVSMLAPGSMVGFRIRACKSAGLVAGDLTLTVAWSVFTYTTTITNAQLTTKWNTFAWTPGTTGIPYNAGAVVTLTIGSANFPTNGEKIYAGQIEPYNVAAPYRGSTAIWSAPGMGNMFDNLYGFQNIGLGNGQDIRGGFEIGNAFYFVKERSLWATYDNSGQPSTWSIEKVSDIVGTPSYQGIGRGNGWVVIAGREGLRFFAGGAVTEDSLLSEEIAPTWETINWQYGHTIWVTVNPEKKQIYIGVPVGAATEPNQVWMLDYREGWANPATTGGSGRKWCIPWTIAANSCALVERENGEQEVLFGSNDASGLVYLLDWTRHDDLGAVIDAYYQTACFGNPSGLSLFGELTMNVNGYIPPLGGPSAYFSTWTVTQDGTLIAMPGVLVYDPALIDPRILMNRIGERIAFRFGMVSGRSGSWWNMSKFVPWAKPYPGAAMRGVNP
jgi:hypothetical protein